MRTPTLLAQIPQIKRIRVFVPNLRYITILGLDPRIQKKELFTLHATASEPFTHAFLTPSSLAPGGPGHFPRQ